jgi:hypothetical protein
MCSDHASSYGVGEEADARRRRDFVSKASRFGALFALCVGIWLISGAGAFWPVWVLLVGAFVLGRAAVEAYRTTGPDESFGPADIDDFANTL